MTNTQQNRQPVYFTDPDGTPCVRVPLANKQGHAELYADDFAALMARDISTNWALSHPNRSRTGGRVRYVQCNVPTVYRNKHGYGTAQGVSRLIMQAGKSVHVKFADRNTLNLRRSNLYLTSGPARRNFADLLPAAANEDVWA